MDVVKLAHAVPAMSAEGAQHFERFAIQDVHLCGAGRKQEQRWRGH
jgi:hypothetical protein